MTKYVAVALLLFASMASQPLRAEEQGEFCKAPDELIAEIKKEIEEEERKDAIDVVYLRALQSRLEGVLEAKITCLEGMLEVYRQAAGNLDGDCDGNH